jgi:hypothetical protein
LIQSVAFYSKSLLPAEKNYDIFNKEMLAVIRAFEEWQHLLEGTGKPIQILTDHKNVEHFTTKKGLNCRQIQWANLLADYNFIIKYRPGAQNGKADILSRRADWQPPKGGGEPTMLLKPELFITAILTDNSLDDLIHDTIHEDKQVKEIIKKLEEGETLKTWLMEDGLLYFQEHIYVPKEKEVRRAVIESRHDAPSAGHLGQFRTFELLSANTTGQG